MRATIPLSAIALAMALSGLACGGSSDSTPRSFDGAWNVVMLEPIPDATSFQRLDVTEDAGGMLTGTGINFGFAPERRPLVVDGVRRGERVTLSLFDTDSAFELPLEARFVDGDRLVGTRGNSTAVELLRVAPGTPAARNCSAFLATDHAMIDLGEATPGEIEGDPTLAPQIRYGVDADAAVRDIAPSREGGYLLAGARFTDDGGLGSRALSLRIDEGGALLWASPDYGPFAEAISRAIERGDGSWFGAGSAENTVRQAAVYGVDAAGTDGESRSIAGIGRSFAEALGAVEQPDGSLAVAGWSDEGSSAGPGEPPVARLWGIAPDLTVQWSTAFSDEGESTRGLDLLGEPGGLRLVARSSVAGTRAHHLLLIETDALGAELSRLRRCGFEIGRAIASTALPDGDLVIVGALDGAGFALRIAPDGQARWSRRLTHPSRLDVAGVAAIGGDIAVVGQMLLSREGGTGDFDGFLALLDGDGNSIALHHYGGPGQDALADAEATDGGLLLAGSRDDGERVLPWLLPANARGLASSEVRTID